MTVFHPEAQLLGRAWWTPSLDFLTSQELIHSQSILTLKSLQKLLSQRSAERFLNHQIHWKFVSSSLNFFHFYCDSAVLFKFHFLCLTPQSYTLLPSPTF